MNEYLHIGKHLWSYGILMQYLCNMHIGFVVALFFYFLAFRAKSTLLYRDGEISKRFGLVEHVGFALAKIFWLEALRHHPYSHWFHLHHHKFSYGLKSLICQVADLRQNVANLKHALVETYTQ